jgi:hypothetical protein
MKYDAMIAAVAHVTRARYMITANPKDYVKFLGEVRSMVRVLAPDQVESEGQLGIVFVMPAQKPTDGST